MIKMSYHIDGTPDGVLTDGNLKIEVNGIDISKYKTGGHPYTMFHLCFNSLLNLLQKGDKWKEWSSLLYGIVGLSYKNIDNIEMEIACYNTVGNSNNFVEEGRFYKVSKKKFHIECLRVIGEFVEDVGWRNEEYIKYQYDPESLRAFVEQYDSLVKQNRSS